MADEAEKRTVAERLVEIQAALKVPKGSFNSFGGFAYRSKEDILEAAKPLCAERGLALTVDDEALCLPNGWVYIVSVARLSDAVTGERVEARGLAREQPEVKGANASQVTGMASSYAGKRALGNLFAVDDTQDADAPGAAAPAADPEGPVVGHCRTCGARYTFASATEMRAYRGCCASPDYEVG